MMMKIVNGAVVSAVLKCMLTSTIDEIVVELRVTVSILVTSLKEGAVCPCVLRDIFDTRSDMSHSRSTAPRTRLLNKRTHP
jgi:hypothetical protein